MAGARQLVLGVMFHSIIVAINSCSNKPIQMTTFTKSVDPSTSEGTTDSPRGADNVYES